jgi:hypothetical protein
MLLANGRLSKRVRWENTVGIEREQKIVFLLIRKLPT